MADTHVVSALRDKRAVIAGLIEKLERKLEQHRADLVHIDGALRLFQPSRDPELIQVKRPYARRRTLYFARNELSRLCLDVLRATDGATTKTDDIVTSIIEAKRFDPGDRALRGSLPHQVLTSLRPMRKRGLVEQMGLGRGVRWRLPAKEPNQNP
jgi:hypothetical protein